MDGPLLLCQISRSVCLRTISCQEPLSLFTVTNCAVSSHASRRHATSGRQLLHIKYMRASKLLCLASTAPKATVLMYDSVELLIPKARAAEFLCWIRFPLTWSSPKAATKKSFKDHLLLNLLPHAVSLQCVILTSPDLEKRLPFPVLFKTIVLVLADFFGHYSRDSMHPTHF